MTLLRLKHQLHTLIFNNKNLTRKASQAQERVVELERVLNGDRYDVTTAHSHFRHEVALLWHQDTLADAEHSSRITGNVVVVARDNASPDTVLDALGTDKPISYHKPHRSVYRITVGDRGKAGVPAVKSFLQQVRSMAPQAWKIQRQRTNITMNRERSLNMLNSRIQHTMDTEPSLVGMKSYVAPNGTSIYLSQADRQSALNPRNLAAPAYEYPVWLHFPIDTSMKNGTGGLNYNTPITITDNVINTLIHATIPLRNDHCNKIPVTNLLSSNNNNNALHNTSSDDRTKFLFLGLASVFLSLIRMRSKHLSINMKSSNNNTLKDSHNNMPIDPTDDEEWTSTSNSSIGDET